MRQAQELQEMDTYFHSYTNDHYLMKLKLEGSETANFKILSTIFTVVMVSLKTKKEIMLKEHLTLYI